MKTEKLEKCNTKKIGNKKNSNSNVRNKKNNTVKTLKNTFF